MFRQKAFCRIPLNFGGKNTGALLFLLLDDCGEFLFCNLLIASAKRYFSNGKITIKTIAASIGAGHNGFTVLLALGFVDVGDHNNESVESLIKGNELMVTFWAILLFVMANHPYQQEFRRVCPNLKYEPE
ncbi:hypothetical protein [Cerasicoccus frondis]|uniref:hypothetical protein n=1 Tax=Cerasicoccus frondis TaxID=490090 RepID=UPI002852591D|nr:hypothetical protein [Cerasicoccus frondis]